MFRQFSYEIGLMSVAVSYTHLDVYKRQVQTSGQLRDIAASRLFLINRAVEMAAAAKDDKFENQVAASVV